MENSEGQAGQGALGKQLDCGGSMNCADKKAIGTGAELERLIILLYGWPCPLPA